MKWKNTNMWTKETMEKILFDAHFVSEVIALALEIARLQRGEDHLQSPDVLHEQFVREKQELATAAEKWDEIPDLIYYATCLIAWGENAALCEVEYDLLPKHRVSVQQVKAACLAKYHLRAAGIPKDIEAERQAIIEAVKQVQLGEYRDALNKLG
jgi:hypothetical protein